MSQYFQADKDTQIKYLNSVFYLGAGLWWALLLLGSFLPDEHISETGRMWLLIITMTYGALIVGANFWSGYRKKQVEWLDAHPEDRRRQIKWLPFGWLFLFVFMLGYHVLIADEPWKSALFQSLLFATTMTAFNYFFEIGRSKQKGV